MAYEVRYTIHLDRPELRGETFPKLPAGKLHFTWTYESYNAAVGEFNMMVKGEYDFASEYVSKVCVVRTHEGKSPTVVRKTVERKRANESEWLRMMRTLAVGSKKHNPHALWTVTYPGWCA